MSKVIKTIKKFSTRKISYTPPVESKNSASNNSGDDAQEPIEQKKKEKKDVKRNKESKEQTGKDKDKKKSKEKTKKKSSEVKTEPDVSPSSEPTRRRRIRKVKKVSSEDGSAEDLDETIVDRENENESGEQSQAPMAQDEVWEEEEVEEVIDDFVGSFDFHNLRESDETNVVDFSCLSPEEIIAVQKKQIQQIADLLVITASNASNLLRHYHWRTEVLLTRYFDNPKAVIKEAGLMNTNPDGDVEAKLVGEGECLVCNDIVSANDSCALMCEHRFCKDCWTSYLTMKITEGEVTRINCPALNCTCTVQDEVVKKLVSKEVYEKFLRFVTQSFVEDNRHFTWCPAPRCGNAITTDMILGQIVKCTCGFRFCFSCHHEDHSPATCEQVKQWLNKCNDDSETGHWLGANTKDCPRCTVSVEKNGGCNHMTCRQCGYEWCWLCSKIWKGHTDFYSCQRYEKAQKKKEKKKLLGGGGGKKSKKQSKLEQEEEEREEKRIALQRYLDYYSKYLNHDTILKSANDCRQKAQAIMNQLQSEQSTLAEVKFIETGCEAILECENVLKYSYLYSYYIDELSSEKHIFTFLQEELEKTTKSLYDILFCTTNSSPSSILRRRTETVDLTKLAQIKKDNLLRGVDSDEHHHHHHHHNNNNTITSSTKL
eukprot:TRINITY_DN109_c0_g1_i1.p1 TRINITY_DN109_c0_g1~~TRINITY_DN109_c0_g1_i1.p1  ORF type:complete len:655 (+),score=184.46 TRINITY_DN109_c0_g1_i1:54-2018(+)